MQAPGSHQERAQHGDCAEAWSFIALTQGWHETSRSRQPSWRAAGLPAKLRVPEASAVLPEEAVLGASLHVYPVLPRAAA